METESPHRVVNIGVFGSCFMGFGGQSPVPTKYSVRFGPPTDTVDQPIHPHEHEGRGEDQLERPLSRTIDWIRISL